MNLRFLCRFFGLMALFVLPAVTNLRAQLYTSSRTFTVVAFDGPNINTADNSGVAVQVKFEFDQALGYLRITLANLSGTAGYTDGVLMGFGFDGPAGATYKTGSFLMESVSAGEPGGVNYSLGLGYSFSGLGSDGSFDFGAGTSGPDGNGGGGPSNGIAGGYTAAFRFQFEGDLTNFNGANYFANNGSDADFGFRFQGVAGVNSEKVVYFVGEDITPPIPEPSTYGMAGVALLAIGAASKRYRVRRSAAFKSTRCFLLRRDSSRTSGRPPQCGAASFKRCR